MNFESGTPKVFHHRAQARKERATLNFAVKRWVHSEGVEAHYFAISRCNSVGVETLSPESPG
jgi:hypothetical protein